MPTLVSGESSSFSWDVPRIQPTHLTPLSTYQISARGSWREFRLYEIICVIGFVKIWAKWWLRSSWNGYFVHIENKFESLWRWESIFEPGCLQGLHEFNLVIVGIFTAKPFQYADDGKGVHAHRQILCTTLSWLKWMFRLSNNHHIFTRKSRNDTDAPVDSRQ